MGQLRFRGKYWYIRYYRNGRRFEENTKQTSKTKAASILKIRKGDIERGLPVTPHHARVTFDEAATDLVNEYKANRRRSLDTLERRLARALLPYFSGRRLASITSADVTAYVTERQAAGAANASINR